MTVIFSVIYGATVFAITTPGLVPPPLEVNSKMDGSSCEIVPIGGSS